MMVFLLVVATLLAPIAALVFADWWRVRRRRKSKEMNTARQPMPGWVNKTINEFREGKDHD